MILGVDADEGAVLTRSGAKNDAGLFYIHIAPEGCFSAAGFYHPEPEDLRRLRSAIEREPKSWRQMNAKLVKAGLAFGHDEPMKRSPKGFEAVRDPELVEAIRRKTYVCSRPIDEKRLGSPDLVADLASFARDALPLLNWGWLAIVDMR